jgi:mono/diheme cytochrome c family protein
MAVAASCPISASASESQDDDAIAAAKRAQALKVFKSQVTPFIANHCSRCHGDKKRKGAVTFTYALRNPGAASFKLLWERASDQMKTRNMPPHDEDDQPTEQERREIVEWIGGVKYLSPRDPGQFIIRRLSKVEYGNTLHDLLGVDPQLAHDLPDEVVGAGYTNTLSPLLMEQYLAIANDALIQVIAPLGAPPTAVQQRLFGAAPAAGADQKAAARKVAHSLARLAYRRPPSDAEVDLLLRVFALATDQGKSYPDALRLMLKAVLVSPQFLFITPGVTDTSRSTTAGDIIPLDDYQLASRLSYLLWATMPDPELSALADAGKLHDPAALAAQARRLTLDPRSRALFDGFGAQWLGLDKLAGKPFDEAKFPQMTPALRTAMYEEARLFFDSVLRENRSLTTFIDSDYSFINATLAPIYGLQATVTGPEMRKVKLANPNRGGILTMPGTLAMSSFPNRTSAVNRGVWVLEQVLGEHVPPPPPDVPSLEKQDHQKVATLTLRERTELHRANPVCANCHKILDPIGFGLENFDAIGRWRDTDDDSGGAIDATGELPGGKRFTTPKELKHIIAARKDDFCRNLTGKLLAYALCRQLEGYDEVVVDQLAQRIAKDEYRMQSLVIGVVTSYPFTHHRLGNQAEAPQAK